MTKNIGQLVGEIYAMLEKQTADDSIKILSSVKTLLGITISFEANKPHPAGSNSNTVATHCNTSSNTSQGNAKEFFDTKSPLNKGEEFAVAAMFAQENGNGDVHTAESIKATIKTQARRKFDEKNFARDMKNAIRQAKFFIGGDTKGEYLLSSIGEKYVNALPDRSAASQSKKLSPSSKKKKKKTSSK